MKKKAYIIVLIAAISILQSCSDLETEVYSEILPKDFYKDDNQLAATVAAAYTPLYAYWAMHDLQDLPSDQTTVPIRSNQGWDDGGLWPRLMAHDFRANEHVGGKWSDWYSGVSACNRIIEILQDYLDPNDPVFSELRTLRAVYYWMLLDLFGNIPLVTSFATAESQPLQSKPEEIYAFLEKELVESVDNLTEDKGSTYAKVNKWVGYTLLAKIYLNAERYGVAPQWQKAADAANVVINSNKYALEAGYFTNFRIENEGSKENIFVVPYDKQNAGQFDVRYKGLQQSADASFGFTESPWGGFSIQTEFYNSFAENDKRRGMFIVGQQYTVQAEPQWSNDLGFFYGNPRDEFKLTDCVEDYNNFTTSEDLAGEDCNVFISTTYTLKSGGRYKYEDGARYGKWEYDLNATGGLYNDFAIFRFADVLLMRAEALWRLDNSSSEALVLVNQIRERAGVDPLATMSEDELYREIKQELALENQARPTIIRFGKFEDPWFLKTDSDPRKRLYPIPQDQIQANPNLIQNPGY